MPGKFITIEGGEGAGKSSCLGFIRQLIQAKGLSVIESREPGGTPLGEELRSLLLGHRDQGLCAESELLLMFAARAEHLARKIRPALARGDWVLCDRFTDASYAYQGAGRGIAPERVALLETWVQQGLQPDLTLLLDIPVEQGLKRAGLRSTPDRFEREPLAFLEAVRRGYLELARAQPGRIKVIDASLDLPAVHGQLAVVMAPLLGEV